jgi:hypothetical protein
MLKNVMAVLVLMAQPCFVSAETLSVDLGHDGQIDKIITSQEGHSGVVEIYENGALAGKFNNLIVDQPAISADVVALADGGLAIEVESEGSRNKYHIISPISKENGKFYVNCNYKTIYDSVDETRSVGSSCKRIELGKFDAADAIADNGMLRYSQDYQWLKDVAPSSCINAVGLEYGNYHIVRCAADGVAETKKQKIIVFNRRDELLFSIIGYELIPGDDGFRFVLGADLANRVVSFEGNLACVSHPRGTHNDILGKAKIGGKLEINYALASADGCMVGDYAYVKQGVNIGLSGVRQGRLVYLLELTPSKTSTGLFVLDQLTPRMRGAWISVPPKSPLSID